MGVIVRHTSKFAILEHVMERKTWLTLAGVVVVAVLCETAFIDPFSLGDTIKSTDVLHTIKQWWIYARAHLTFIQMLMVLVLPYLIYRVLVFLFKPIRYEKSLVKSEDAPKNLLRRYQNSGPVPYPYPNGWFFISLSGDLKKGAVKHISFLGQELALFRGQDGKARVLSAFCPHLGANLGVGGVVKDNCLRCPFHGWEFDGDNGKCVKIPYSDSIPSAARLDTAPLQECNGVIYIWHHAGGESPSWEIPRIQDITSWRYHCDGHSMHEVCAHVQEIPENGADNAHLNILHTRPVLQFLEIFGFTHYWAAEWTPATEDNRKHIAQIHLTQCFQFFGKTIPLTTLDVTIEQIGPGVVILQFNTAVGTGYVVQSVTPIEPMLQHTVHSVHMPWWIPRIIGKGLLGGLVVQVERDVPVWNNKTFVRKPLLCKGDGKISTFRRWYSQFYSPDHLAQSKLNKSILDW